MPSNGADPVAVRTAPSRDPRWVAVARWTQMAGAAGAALVGSFFLIIWLIPGLTESLAPWWSQMKANTALSVVLLAVAILVMKSGRWLALALVFGSAFLTVSGLVGHLNGESSAVETFLASDSNSPAPGLMSIQSATWMLLLAVLLALSVLHSFEVFRRAWLGSLVSVGTVLLIAATVTLASGHVFGALEVIGQDSSTLNSRQTAISFVFLQVSWIAYWALDGRWQPLLNKGMSAIALRRVIAASTVAPISVAVLVNLPIGISLSPAAAMALLIAITVVVGVVIATGIYRKLSGLESELRQQALTDSMTGLWNAGAYARLGGQLLSEARRRGEPISVVVIDIDGLKQVNDTLGHESGSELLTEFGGILRSLGRKEDHTARVGGDEFAIVMKGDASAADLLLDRLQALVAEANTTGHKWAIKYSAGTATSTASSDESLRELTTLADAAMYSSKATKKGQSPTS